MATKFKFAGDRGISFLVACLTAVLVSAKTLGQALGDGFQLTDVGALLTVVPDIKTVVANGQGALTDLADLTPDESAQVAVQVAAGANLPAEGILGKIPRGLELLARTHQEVADDIELVHEWGDYLGEFREAA
jgi:hypothetical protein